MLNKLWGQKANAATPGAASTDTASGGAAGERVWKRVLAPAVDTPYSMRSLEVAYRLAQGTGAVVHLAFVIEVPRSLPLEAALPDAEGVAAMALRDAQEAARPYNVPVEAFVHRTRSAPEGILKLIGQAGIDLLVLGGRPDALRGLPPELIKDLFRRAPCEVVLDYIAGEK